MSLFGQIGPKGKTVRTMNISIIPIEEKHAQGFHACLDFVAKEKKYLLFQEAPPIESTVSFVKENVDTGQVQLVAMDDEIIVGWCDILRPKIATYAHVGVVGIGLLPTYRGKGIGRRLLEEAITKALSSGIERIELAVYDTNSKAMDLYRSVGFIEEGRMIKKAKINETYIDMVCMALLKKR
jgi:ribosomal protein S18 acetylase RimI-like enzyme